MSNNVDNYTRYLETYFGKELLKKYSINEYGEWEIFGEDPNADFGGYHHEPSLVLCKGKLGNVIAAAVELPGFWSWGAGGKIVKREIVDVTAISPAKLMALKEERLKILARLDEIEKILNIK